MFRLTKKTSWVTLYLLVLLFELILAYIAFCIVFEPYVEIKIQSFYRPNSEAIFYLEGVGSWLDYEMYDSCATRDWNKGSQLLVTNLDNEKSIVCTVRDYGPDPNIHPDRIVDLNRDQFSQLAPTRQGLIKNIQVYEFN